MLDPDFGVNGKVSTDIGGEDTAYAMALQADGKVVAAGYTRGSSYDFAAARYNEDGTLDASFGGGTVRTDISGEGSFDIGHAVAIQADGKIVVAGSSNSGGDTDFTVARYNGDGSVDTAFGRGGSVHTDVSGTDGYDAATAVAVQADGKIVAAGSSAGRDSTDFALVRYSPDGTLDTTFGAGGRTLTDLGGADRAAAAAVAPNGAIVVAGDSDTGDSTDFAVTRYRPDGGLDASFGDGGAVVSDLRGAGGYDEGRAVTVRSDGAVVVTGSSNAAGTRDFALVRYRPDGSADPTFGTDGTVLTDLSGVGGVDSAVAVTLTPRGQIVAAGIARLPRNTDMAVARYYDDGSLDTAFGDGGATVTDMTGVTASDAAYATVARPDGRIVVAGSAGSNGRTDFALAQFLG